MFRIAHISDTHIRNLKYHTEYNHVFKEIYSSLKEAQPDYIVHTGDLAHTKTELSPEYFHMASNFLKNLADIAPTIIILGNHDGNLKNDNRQDAITPIIEALNHPNLKLLKNSGEYSPEDGLTFNVLSVFDRNNWKKPSSNKAINIALYHGAIQGSEVGTGFAMDHGEDDICIFEDFDYAMLGDIHKMQSLDPDQKVWYAGSTVQQNFGESILKGYLIWNIFDKDKHSIEKKLFSSLRPFVTVNVTPEGQLPNEDIQKGSNLRIVCEYNIPKARLVRLQDYAQNKWSPYSIQVVNRATKEADQQQSSSKAENIRNQVIFEKYVNKFLDTKQIDEETRGRAMEIARDYFRKHVGVDNSRNVVWKLNKMKWDYLFNYGKDNELDFSKLNGLVGIFGKNYSGKSSIIDAALFGLYNTTSKGEKKNSYIVNQNQEKAKCSLEISVGDDIYKIIRTLEKTKTSAKTNLDFTKYVLGTNEESKNGTSRNDTDANIQSTLGSYRDFLMTSFSAQGDSLGFINEGSTKRKEILAKFLDLEIFEDMNKAVKKDSSDLKGAVKHLHSFDWERKLSKATSEYSEILQEIEDKTIECESLNKRLQELKDQKIIIQNQVSAASQKEIDIDKLENDLKSSKNALKKAQEEMLSIASKLKEKSAKLENLTSNASILKAKAKTSEQELKDFSLLKEQLKKEIPILDKLSRQYDSLKSKIETLHTHEYDPNCKFCCDNEFVKQAEQAKVQILDVEIQKDKQNNVVLDLKMKCSLFDEASLKSNIEEYNNNDRLISSLKSEVANLKLQLENNEGKINLMEHKIPSIQEDIRYYNENIDAYQNLSTLKSELSGINQTLMVREKSCKKCSDDLLELMSEKGSTKRTIEEAREGIKKIKDMERDHIAYDLFIEATNANGISYEVIKSMLSKINTEISSVLASIVDFEITLEDDGESLELYIKHPNYDPRPLCMGSGAEKTIASMAIRLALISVSSLPRSDFFILDEPATALDAEHMEGFVRLLQMIKAHFRTVLLITHLESLKDVVDTTIEINKSNGYAQVKL